MSRTAQMQRPMERMVEITLRKGDEVIAAGSSMISAAAMANVGRFMDRGEE